MTSTNSRSGRCLVYVKEPGCTCFGPRSHTGHQEGLTVEVLPECRVLQGKELGCMLWMGSHCLEEAKSPDVFLSYNFLSQTQTERVPFKLPKFESVTKTDVEGVTCQLHVSGKDYRHLESIQNMFVPLIVKLLKQISQYKGFYNKNGEPLTGFLEVHEVAISFEREGFQLMKLLTNDSIAFTTLRFNPVRGCVELHSPPQTGRSLFSSSEKRFIVHNLSAALRIFLETPGWPTLTVAPAREPSYLSEDSEPLSDSDSSVPDEDNGKTETRTAAEVIGRKHCHEELKEEKGALAAMWWEHGALRALVQWVSGLTWSKDSEVFELACRSTEALLGNERVGSPVAETFIEAVLVVIKEKGTECLAIYKQLLAVLDIPAVKQAAVKLRLMDSLMSQYQMMTQDCSSSSSSISSRESLDDICMLSSNHVAELQTTTTLTHTGDDGTHVMVHTGHSSSPDGLWTATPTSSAAHLMFTGSEGTISTLSLELAESSWGGVMRTASPANSSRHTSHPSDFTNKPEVPRLTFYWLKNPDVVRPGAGSTTQTTIGLPDGTAIVVDDADEFVDRTGGLPPPGSRSAHICKLTADSNTARVKKCNFDRVIARTVHAWAVPVDELEESESHIAYQIKCTILEAFLGFSSLNMGDERTQFELDTDQGMDGPLSDVSGNGSVEPFNPSKLVATELLAPTWQVFPGEQPPVRRGPGDRGGALALAVVHEYACRPPQGVQSFEVPGIRLFMPQDQTGGSYHALVGGVKSRLSHLMSVKRRDACVLEEAVSLINLLGDFVASSPSPAQAQLVAYSCSDTFVHMEAALFKSQRAALWTIPVRRVFHALLQLFKSMLERAGDVVLWAFLIGSLLERSQWVRLVKDYSKVVLFSDKMVKEHDAEELACLRSVLWSYFKALVTVVSHRREGTDINVTSNDYQSGGQSFGRDCLDHLEFLVTPESGLAPRVLCRSNWAPCIDKNGACVDMHVQVLSFLKTLFSVPRRNFISQNDLSMYYLELHWGSFKRLYQVAAASNSEVGLVARLHLEVVREMMTHRWTHVFYQVKVLGILELLSDEVSLELREHSAKKLAAFLPPGSLLACKNSMKDLPRQLVFPGTGYMVTEGEPGGKRYVESVLTMDSRNLRGIEGGVLAPLEEATEDEGKLLSTVCSSSKSSQPSGRRPLTNQGKPSRSTPQTQEPIPNAPSKKAMSTAESVEVHGVEDGAMGVTVGDPPATTGNKPPVHLTAPKKVAGATDGRKVYRRKGNAPPLGVVVSEMWESPGAASPQQNLGPLPTQVLLYAKPSQIPTLRGSRSTYSNQSGDSLAVESPEPTAGTATTDGVCTQAPLSRLSEDLPSTMTHSQGASEADFQQMVTNSGHKLMHFGESRIPRVPKRVVKVPATPVTGKAGKKHSQDQATGRTKSHTKSSTTSTQKGSKTVPGRGPKPPRHASITTSQSQRAQGPYQLDSKGKTPLTLRSWSITDADTARQGTRPAPRRQSSYQPTSVNTLQTAPSRTGVPNPVPLLNLSSKTQRTNEDALTDSFMPVDGNHQINKRAEGKKKATSDQQMREGDSDAKKSLTLVPSLDLSVIGIQHSPKPSLDPELLGPPSYCDSSCASSEMSQWSHSDFDFNDKTIPNNEALENSQKMNERVNSSLAIHQRPDSGELDPSYRTPRSGFASEGDTSGPPTFGLVCRARNSREPTQSRASERAEVNFDFGRMSASSNRILDSDGAGSFVLPSDFDYTGDMSDDARRLLSLERKHYGYASSDGTLSVMEMVSPSRPISVPPIHFPGVGVVQGISRSHSFTSSRNSRGSRKKVHGRPSRQSIADSRKGSLLSKAHPSDSRASMSESRRSWWDRGHTVMDTRSTMDTYRTMHRSGSSFHIPDDFEWTGDVSDDCRRLEALERRQRKGEFISSSSGFSLCDTFSEDMRMSPVSLMGPRRSSMSASGSHAMARSPHIMAAAKSRPSSATSYEVGGPGLRRQGRPSSSANSRSRYPSDFDGFVELPEDIRWKERAERHYNTLQAMPSTSGWSGAYHWGGSAVEGGRRPNVPFLSFDSPQNRASHSRKSSSLSGYPQGSPGCFLYSKGGKRGGKTRGDGLNESPRMGPRPSDPWNQSSKPVWCQATSSSQRSVHYSAMQWNLNENKRDSVGESEVNRLLSVGKARKELEAIRRKKPKALTIVDGPLSLRASNADTAPKYGTSAPPSPYSEARAQRAVYRDNALHTVVLEVLLEGVLLEEGTRVYRDDEMDEDTQKIAKDLPHALLHHLNHDCAVKAVAALRERFYKQGAKRARLLRLLVRSLFPADLYKSTKRMAKGAFAHVHQCILPVQGGPATCAVKVVDLPGEGTDEKSLLDLYSEVSILEEFHGKSCVCELFDYGITHEAAFLVMKEYKCSLLEWRHRLPPSCPNSTRLFLRIFRNVVEAVKLIHDNNVVHFDLKCSNVLLDPLPGVAEAHIWSPPTEEPPFRIVVADFGEARSYSNSWEARTVRNRGTEFNKSPEMLKIADALKRDLPEFDRRKRPGAGPPSDVWALGCLLFELVTGQMLQYDDDWARFFVRVTRSALPVLSEERMSLLDHQSHAVVVGLLEFMLVRDQSWRPSLTMLLRRLDTVLNTGSLPPYRRIPSQTQTEDAMLSPVERYPGISMFGEIGDWHSDMIRLTGRHLLTSLNAARDPWILAKHNISIVVMVSGGVVTSDTGAIRAATARANIELLEINVGSSDNENGVQDEHIRVLLNSDRYTCMGLTCEPAYKRQLVTIMQKILEGEHGYEYYEGILDLWRRLKT